MKNKIFQTAFQNTLKTMSSAMKAATVVSQQNRDIAMPKFINTTTGQELTAGQALDVWLKSEMAWFESEDVARQIHFFADAADLFGTELQMVRKAGIDIKFGE